MNAIKYVKGDATKPELRRGNNIIAHIVNNQGLWGAGFTASLDKLSLRPHMRYREWYNRRVGCYEKPKHPGRVSSMLGQNQNVDIGYDDAGDTYLFVVNMCAQNGVRGPNNPRPISYPALYECLKDLRKSWHFCGPMTVHIPRIGAGLAGGDWSTIERIILSSGLCEVAEVIVYDLP